MHAIKNNPYRVLGVLSNSGAKAIAANQGKLKAFLKTKQKVEFPNDFTKVLGSVDRTEETVNNAVSAISLPKDKLSAGFFWFMSENNIDEIALNNLRNGDIDKAISVQRKKKTVAACINLAIMYLLKEDWQKAIYCYAHLLNYKEMREKLLSVISDNANLLSDQEIVEIFCDEITQSFPDVDWYAMSRIASIEIDGRSIDLTDFWKDSYICAYFAKCHEDKIIKEFEALMKQSEKATESDINLKRAKNLKTRSHSILLKMKRLWGKDNLKYKTYADKVANQMLNLCVAYYNAEENDLNRPRKVLDLTKYALRIAEGQVTRERCLKNFEVIQEAYDALPPEEVVKEFEEIDFHINNYKRQGNHLLLAACVQGCETALNRIKGKLGATDKRYINESTDVVHFVINTIVDEVNAKQKAYNDAPQYLDDAELKAYKDCLRWAKPIMDRLVNFAKDARCVQRFRENKDTLDSLYNKYCSSWSSIPSSPPGGPRNPQPPRRPNPTPTPTPPPDEGSSAGCIFFVLCMAVLFILFCYSMAKGGSNSNSSSLYEECDTTIVDYTYDDVDTVAVDYDDDYNYNSSSDYQYEEPQKSERDILLDQYKGNSLSTGTTPYRSLYGGNSKSGSSSLSVRAPLGSDVIVMIKNTSGKVLKHAYIKSGGTYTFHVSAGTYQPFFIFGNSWCPEIEAPNGQVGYFLEDVSISKDSPQYIDTYQELSYTLQMMEGGNFSAQGSNAYEAF